MIEHILDDFHEICVNLGIKKKIKTSRGIVPMQDVKIDYLVNALTMALVEIVKRRLYNDTTKESSRQYYKIYELLYEDIYRVSKQIKLHKNQLAIGKLVQTLREKDPSLFDIWKKKIPKAMLNDSKDKERPQLTRNMTMTIDKQSTK